MELFNKLFSLHDNHEHILEICLKHTPNLEKDDVVLLRTNFKLDLEKKHSELLSLLKKYNLEQVNQFLSNLYHKSLYNLNFKVLKKERILDLLALANENSQV
eukprot:GHVR01019808.1.p1 GENE.GHVR01019808.1~~GHVR01019808.1.p1  ORF type:complete len:102 (+),score=0.44 GHVR01019808.1:1807-2112(+)